MARPSRRSLSPLWYSQALSREVDPGLDRLVNDSPGFGGRPDFAEMVASQANDGDPVRVAPKLSPLDLLVLT